MAVALGSMDAHFDCIVAKVCAEIEEYGGLLDLLAGTVSDDSCCLEWYGIVKRRERIKRLAKEKY